MNWQAFSLTVRLAAIVSTLLVAIGIPIAYWLTYSRWRWKFLVEAAVALPIVLPPTVLGFYVLVALGSRSPLGRWWESLTGHTLAFTFEGLVIGSLLYSLPFAVQPFAASFGSVDRTLLHASASLGHSPLQTFRRIVLPLSKAGLVTGFALSFAHTLGEFGVVLMVGGNRCRRRITPARTKRRSRFSSSHSSCCRSCTASIGAPGRWVHGSKDPDPGAT